MGMFTALYVTVVSSLTEVGENQRMRFFLDPLILAVAAAGLRALWPWIAGVVRSGRTHSTGQARFASLN